MNTCCDCRHWVSCAEAQSARESIARNAIRLENIKQMFTDMARNCSFFEKKDHWNGGDDDDGTGDSGVHSPS